MVTYDDRGFYGHPDHIQAHRVAWRAFELAGGLVSKFYATAIPRSVLAESIQAMRGERAGVRPAWTGPAGSGPAARASRSWTRWMTCRSARRTRR